MSIVVFLRCTAAMGAVVAIGTIAFGLISDEPVETKKRNNKQRNGGKRHDRRRITKKQKNEQGGSPLLSSGDDEPNIITSDDDEAEHLSSKGDISDENEDTKSLNQHPPSPADKAGASQEDETELNAPDLPSDLPPTKDEVKDIIGELSDITLHMDKNGDVHGTDENNSNEITSPPAPSHFNDPAAAGSKTVALLTSILRRTKITS